MTTSSTFEIVVTKVTTWKEFNIADIAHIVLYFMITSQGPKIILLE